MFMAGGDYAFAQLLATSRTAVLAPYAFTP
jgi:hypothetical protein